MIAMYLFLALLLTSSALAVEANVDVEIAEVSDSAELANIEPDDITNFDDSEPLLSNIVSDVNRTINSLYNQLSSANVSFANETVVNQTRKLVKCRDVLYNTTTDEEVELAVEIINGTRLVKLLTPNPEVTSRYVEADCVLVLFYSRICPFSSHAAPHYNALARAYPNIKTVALDALRYHGINAQYGIVGVPTIKMFHNGRPVGKFNGTEYNLHSFSRFVNAITGQQPGQLVVLSKDFQGPVSSVVENEIDYFLVLSWMFIIVCSVYYFGKSRWWQTIVEAVQNNWRESEAQHEHAD